MRSTPHAGMFSRIEREVDSPVRPDTARRPAELNDMTPIVTVQISRQRRRCRLRCRDIHGDNLHQITWYHRRQRPAAELPVLIAMPDRTANMPHLTTWMANWYQ